MAATTSHDFLFTSNDERVCGNYAHWQEERGILGRHGIKYAPCALDGQGVELCDAPGGMALMNPAGNCRSYGDCWAPSEAYLEEIHYAEDARQAARRPWHGAEAWA